MKNFNPCIGMQLKLLCFFAPLVIHFCLVFVQAEWPRIFATNIINIVFEGITIRQKQHWCGIYVCCCRMLYVNFYVITTKQVLQAFDSHNVVLVDDEFFSYDYLLIRAPLPIKCVPFRDKINNETFLSNFSVCVSNVVRRPASAVCRHDYSRTELRIKMIPILKL